MPKIDRASVKERIRLLVRLRSTGTPCQLAEKFGISERSVKRIIREMKRDGEVLRYDPNRMSYVDTGL